jgi:YD repeat-containing protein
MTLFSQSRSTTTSRSGSDENDVLKTQLPDVIPASPDAFSFTEYGKNNVNEYKGKLSNTIALYNYTAGQLSTAVSLGYSGAGVKVEDMATWVGINWNLSAGGVITRQIKDGVDEGVTTREMIDEEHMKINADSLCAPYSQYYWARAYYNRDYNNEVDIFNFSFDGYSGSFYLDGQFNPVYIENENELKIAIIGTQSTNLEKFRNNYTFMITTPTGVKYYFGGNVTESTRVLSGGQSLDSDGITSFYLFKIEHPVNGTIEFEYDTVAMRKQNLSKSYNMTATLAAVGPNMVSLFNKSIFSTRINDLKRLKKIKSLNTSIEVIFNRTDYDNNYHFTSVLNSIEVKNTIGNKLLKKINFTYGAKTAPGAANDFQNASRFFLTKLEIDKDLDTVGNKSEAYTFEYDDPYSLPNRIESPGNLEIDPSNSRDYAGYYNGKPNRSLIANDERFEFTSTVYFADLHPDFSKGKKGSLTKITYPTKGYSTFEYEPVPAKKPVHKNYGFVINSNSGNEFEYPLQMEVPGTIMGPLSEPVYVNMPNIYQDQTIWFKIIVGTPLEHESNSVQMQGKGVEFIIKDITDPQNVITTVFTQLHLTTQPERSFSFIKGHQYSFRFQFKDNYTSGSYNMLEASLSFSLFEGYEKVDGGGIRLKNEKNYNFDGTKTHEKRYYYGSIDGSYNDISRLEELRFYPKISYGFAIGDNNSAVYKATFSSEFLNRYNADTEKENPENFPIVSISLGGDNFEKGGVEKTFLHVKNTNIERLFTAHDGCWSNLINGEWEIECWENRSGGNSYKAAVIDNYIAFQKNEQTHFNGKLLCERSYVKKDGALFKVKEQESQYVIRKDNSKKVTNFIGTSILGSFYNPGLNFCYSIPGDPSSTLIHLNGLYGIYMGYYYTYVFNQKLDKTITTDYIEPIPMSSYVAYNSKWQSFFASDDPNFVPADDPDGYITQDVLEAPYKKMVTTQTYEYGTLRGMPTKVTMTNSNGELHINENVYVNQYGTLTGLTGPQTTAYTTLLAQNNVATPIETRERFSLGLKNKKRTTYQILSGNKIVPERIYTAKSTQPLEERAVFEEYDSKGNPTLMSLTGGVKIKYLYNANNQVIAKIENFTGTLDPNTNSIVNVTTFRNQFPNAMVSVFEYDPGTNLLVKMYDPNGKITTYEYDVLHRLKLIKDNDNNVIKEFDQNFKN